MGTGEHKTPHRHSSYKNVFKFWANSIMSNLYYVLTVDLKDKTVSARLLQPVDSLTVNPEPFCVICYRKIQKKKQLPKYKSIN